MIRFFITLAQILTYLRMIMATQQETLNTLNEINTTLQSVNGELDKVQSETATSVKKISDLEAAIQNSGNTSPEVDAALQAAKASVQQVADHVTAIDNLVPDTVQGPDTSQPVSGSGNAGTASGAQ